MVSRPPPGSNAAAQPKQQPPQQPRAGNRGDRAAASRRRQAAGGGKLTSTPYHLLLYVLSVDDHVHSKYRCFQRTVFLEAFGLQFGGFVRIDEFRTVRLTYVLEDTKATAESVLEASRHGDVLRLASAQTCLGKVIAALRQIRLTGVHYNAVLFSDDDAFIHPHRLALDMAEFSWATHLVFGTLSWGAGWDERREAHYGYGNLPAEVAGFLVDKWKQVGSQQGPFPFPNGFVMGLSSGTVGAINEVLDTRPRLQALQTFLRSKQPTRKCSPEPDAGLGYLIAQLPPGAPLTFVDLSSSQRVHFWRTRVTEEHLSHSIIVMHGAKEWSNGFEFAARAISRVPRGRRERSRRHRCLPGFARLEQTCALKVLPLINNKRDKDKPALAPRCPSYYSKYWAPNVTWCSVDELAAPRIRPALANVSRALFEQNRTAPRCPYVVPRLKS